jgi:ABC-type dipeptide/oligopeptide/nickel transport system permease subunit
MENDNKDLPKLTSDDFKFVQLDKTIHDVKFETKPTTFFKDAMRRFVKNKSSVVAAVILGVLILGAIIVPSATPYKYLSADTNKALSDLSPRWAGLENLGILDGKSQVSGRVYNPTTKLPVGTESVPTAVSNITTYESTLSGSTSEFAVGGDVALIPQIKDADSKVGYKSPNVTLDSSKSVTLAYETVSDSTLTGNYEGAYSIKFVYQEATATTEEEAITIVPQTTERKATSIADFSSSLPEGKTSGYFEFTIQQDSTKLEGDSHLVNELLIRSFKLTSSVFDSGDDATNPDNASFTDANAMLMLNSFSSGSHTSWGIKSYTYEIPSTTDKKLTGETSLIFSLYKANITLCDYTYDGYEAALGVKTYALPGTKMDEYINNGYLTIQETNKVYTSSDDHSQYTADVTVTILNESKCPVQGNGTVKVEKGLGITSKTYTIPVNMALYYGLDAHPYFIFGTDDNGLDLFARVFAGLRTSLLLGLATALVNIIIGVIWGSISGYFGGVTDLIMERITEILGGVPWIVVMTLCILHLGSNVWTFLLALVLTGWIGMSSLTRSQFYRFKGREYVLASRTLGAKDSRLIFKHILPNSMGTLVTSGVMMIPSVIYDEATISYLGLGLTNLTSFGVTLSETQQFIWTYPYMVLCTAIVMSILMISINLFGNGLRDALNPSLKGVD